MGESEPDPLVHVAFPPPEDTLDQDAARKRHEADAQRASDKIDKGIERERAEMSRRKRGVVKVLLLGQSESGKSKALKYFKMKYAPAAWGRERGLWRPVIQFNLVRSIITIIDTLQAEMDSRSLLPSPSTPQPLAPPNYAYADALAPTPPPPTYESSLLIDKHQLFKLRLDPLRQVEEDLKRLLGVRIEDVAVLKAIDSHTPSPGDVLENMERRRQLYTRSSGNRDGRQGRNGDEATEIIASCRENMMALWADEAVRAVLEARGIRLEDSAGFFLNDLERIATRNYEPSDDDILRAKFPDRTSTIQEHRIRVENAIGPAHNLKEWIFYDVGAQTMTHVWQPYLVDVDAIIFLAPILCLDDPKDPHANGLDDTMAFWRAMCSSTVRSRAPIILSLSKYDPLEGKPNASMRLGSYLGPNGAAAAIEWLKDWFRSILRQCSPQPRAFDIHVSSRPSLQLPSNHLDYLCTGYQSQPPC